MVKLRKNLPIAGATSVGRAVLSSREMPVEAMLRTQRLHEAFHETARQSTASPPGVTR